MPPRLHPLRTLFSFLVLLLAAGASAQRPAPLIVDSVGKGTFPLAGPWQFHLGDNPAWADPAFDDSAWVQIDVSRPWGDQGHWGYTGHAWYRRTLDFDGTAPNLALFVPTTGVSYEVYWNGRLLGHTDRMPRPPLTYPTAPSTFLLGKPERGVLAFHALSEPPDSTTAGNQFGLSAIPRIGNPEAVANLSAAERAATLRHYFLNIAQIIVYGQLFLLAAFAWFRNRTRKLLFWMAAFLLAAGLWIAFDVALFPWLATNVAGQFLIGGPFHTIEDVALWYLLLYLLDLDHSARLMRVTRILACVALGSALLDDFVIWSSWIDTHIHAFQIIDAVLTAGFSVPEIFPLVLIPFAFTRRLDPARRVVAVTALLSNMYFVVQHTAIQGRRFTRWTLSDTMLQPMFTVAGVDVSAPALINILLVASIVYAVFHYSVEQGRRQTALEQELRNARAVQEVLIPEAMPSVPGFAIDSVYFPAGEVGGDFFQVLAANDGGILAVIGDVSGKGMPAAMTVSLLVGTVRTLAHYTQSPGEILAAMNVRMLGRSQGGFTTCLVLRAGADGALTVANAGHIAPYVAGRELPLQNGLPLGLAADSAYPESVFHLQPGEQLTLLTDGVVEARAKTGALLGFERTAAISHESAATVARTAQTFGQDDDITVLTLVWQGASADSPPRAISIPAPA